MSYGHASDARLARIGMTIRRERHKQSLRQVDLAVRAGLTPEEISRVELARGKGLRVTTLLRILDALDLTDRSLAALASQDGDATTQQDT